MWGMEKGRVCVGGEEVRVVWVVWVVWDGGGCCGVLWRGEGEGRLLWAHLK